MPYRIRLGQCLATLVNGRKGLPSLCKDKNKRKITASFPGFFEQDFCSKQNLGPAGRMGFRCKYSIRTRGWPTGSYLGIPGLVDSQQSAVAL
jgi:hypothetical protein